MFRGLALAVLFLWPIVAQDGIPPLEVWLGEGISQYQSKHYPEAIAAFQKVAEINPAAARWYLAQIYLAQYTPGQPGSENLGFAERARNEFQHLLQLNSENTSVMASLGCLTYQEAQGIDNLQDKESKLDDARDWYQRWLSADSENPKAHYALGVLDAQKLYYALVDARSKIGMKPEVQSPLTDAAVRAELNKKYGSLVEDGISHFNHTIEQEPENGAAMSYLSLLIRERADLRDTQEEYAHDLAQSAVWYEKARKARSVEPSAPAASALPGLPAMTAPLPPTCGRSEPRVGSHK